MHKIKTKTERGNAVRSKNNEAFCKRYKQLGILQEIKT